MNGVKSSSSRLHKCLNDVKICIIQFLLIKIISSKISLHMTRLLYKLYYNFHISSQRIKNYSHSLAIKNRYHFVYSAEIKRFSLVLSMA